MKKHIPNTITLCNLMCGCIAVSHALNGCYVMALSFIIAGAVFDFFDGFAARLLHVVSPVGKELDSLADVITFGFAPAAIAYRELMVCIGLYLDETGLSAGYDWLRYLSAAAFLIAAFSALRLARFNLDTRQATSFIGLPTPANALWVAAMVITLSNNADRVAALSKDCMSPALASALALCVLIAVSCTLLVCNLPLFALKFKDFSWEHNDVRYIFLGVSVAILIAGCVRGEGVFIASVGCVILWYVILSLIFKGRSE